MKIGAIKPAELRVTLLLGLASMLAFMAADIPLLPDSLHDEYIFSRLLLQTPIVLVGVAITFTSIYFKIYNLVLCAIGILVTYVNYWFTAFAWQTEKFSFSYEGVLLYALFVTFILRLKFTYALIYQATALLGFVLMTIKWPIYGQYNWVNVGFVAFGLAIILWGARQREAAFQELNHMNSELKKLSETDLLTGIHNRRAFETKFDSIIKLAYRAKLRVAVFMIDLDKFKKYNDNHGHLAGDKIIIKQAHLLKAIFNRDSDIVARFGGEEFIAVSIEPDSKNFRDLGEKIVQAWFDDPSPRDSNDLDKGIITCSVGGCIATPKTASGGKYLIECADKALFKAKRAGRSRFEESTFD